jgi:serine/threonine protein kinase
VFRTQLSASILALHSVQIHHHDIEERNILVDRTGRVTLIDLNTAKEISGRCMWPWCPDAEVLMELGMDVKEYEG